jgi:hypothetical protein
MTKMSNDRFNRNELFFGAEGQERIRRTTCTIVGVGGLGTHVVQQLSLLGVGHLFLIDSEELEDTNRNRYIGVRHDDPVPGSPKVELGKRLVHSIDPDIKVELVPKTFITDEGFVAIRAADYVFGCLDCEGARLILTELCSAYARPYFDLASDVNPKETPPKYGGRVCYAANRNGCMVCLNVLDLAEAGRDLEGEAERRNRDAIYGVGRNALGRSGPSVVSINGIIASVAVTEFMVMVTGLRAAHRLMTYYGHTGRMTLGTDQPRNGCYYCGLWGRGADADVERYVRDGFGQRIR